MPFPAPVVAATGPVPVSSPCRLLHLPPQDWQPFNLPPKGRQPLLLAGTPILVPPQGRQKPYLSSNSPLCFLQDRQQHSFPFQRPASPSFASDKLQQSASAFSPSIWKEFCKNSARIVLKRGIDFFGKLSQIKGATLQEKEEKMDVEDYIHVKINSNIVEEPTYDDYLSTKEPAMVENWVIRFEQSMNVFLTDSVIKVLDLFYSDRHYARFFVLETIARVPYFAFISVLHMYESFGWWRRADYLKVHFAESWNELHHLLIMEELGGNALWFDRFLAQHIAIFYYFMTAFMYALSPRMAYHLSECVEKHAYSTYDKFLKLHGEELKKLPAPQVAIEYYMNEDMYLFDEFQTSRTPNSRRPEIENLYDVFLNVRDDEGEHCKTMRSCQTHGNLRSPHSNYGRPQDVECAVPPADCEGFLDCFKKSLADSK